MAGANIELHDMRFVIAEHIEETYDTLRREWWGKPRTLHIDCWSELTQADGYKITLSREPSEGTKKLYYVNVGGYDAQAFIEQHQNLFVVAESESKAKVRALKTVRHWNAFHKDEIYEAEQTFCLNRCAGEANYFVHLEKIDDERPAPFTCYYKPIGKNSN